MYVSEVNRNVFLNNRHSLRPGLLTLLVLPSEIPVSFEFLNTIIAETEAIFKNSRGREKKFENMYTQECTYIRCLVSMDLGHGILSYFTLVQNYR